MTGGARIGSVPYLNARPLIDALPGEVHLAHPVQLSAMLRAGELDAALVPVVEVLEHDAYQVLNGYCVGCDGPVHSVFLAHETPLAEVCRVALDAASRTSVQLLRVLLHQQAGLRPDYVSQGEPANAQLRIGDQALRFRENHPHWRYFDLGEEWKRWTGLPFVFAVWALRHDAPPETARLLREAGRAGVAARHALAANEAERQYLCQHIRYELGPRQQEAIGEFSRRLGIEGLPVRPPTAFVE